VSTVIDIGGFLRTARQRRRLTLGQIADATKLPTTVFDRIERNEFDRLRAAF
jgi:cytoskeletal protein RodZ